MRALYIENELNKGETFKNIARFLCKGPTAISKEVRAHRLSDWYHKGTFYKAHNFWTHRFHCRKTNVCGKIMLCDVKCTSCPTCNQTCTDFVKEQCKRLEMCIRDRYQYLLPLSLPGKAIRILIPSLSQVFLPAVRNHLSVSSYWVDRVV